MSKLDKTVINLKVSKELKQEAQKLADDIGVPLTTVITAGLKEFVRSRSLSLSALPRLKPEIEQEMAEAIVDYKNNRNISPVFSSPKEAADYLRKL
jgi:antitoxin component of RelBE/YafQ-DinJ toxin-antitoxin module